MDVLEKVFLIAFALNTLENLGLLFFLDIPITRVIIIKSVIFSVIFTIIYGYIVGKKYNGKDNINKLFSKKY